MVKHFKWFQEWNLLKNLFSPLDQVKLNLDEPSKAFTEHTEMFHVVD